MFGNFTARTPAARLLRLVFAFGLCSFGCAGHGGAGAQPASPSEAATSGADGGGSIKEKLEQEADPIGKQPVRGGEKFTAYVEAKAPPKVERKDQGFAISADLGWGGPLECFVYDHVIDAGAAVNIMLKEAAKNVKFNFLAPYFVEHQGLEPMLAIRGVYQVERQGQKFAGDFKLIVVPRSEYPLMCWLDTPGYAKSFARVTSEFAKSFKYQSTRAAPTRGELWIVSVDGVPVGFSRETTYVQDGGKVSRIALSARFLPAGPGEMSFDDDAEIIAMDKDGAITTGKYVSAENGETAYTIDIERTKAGYNYVGTIQGKAVNGSFKSKQPLKGHYAVELKLKGLAASKKKAKFEAMEYDPSVDAANPSKVTYEVTPEGEGMTVTSSLGQRGMTSKANGQGVIKQILLSAGSKKIQIDLVEESGGL
jgi:hypothetical protein